MGEATALPLLRSDLQFIDHEGGGLIYDPLNHRYFRVDQISMAVLKVLSRMSGFHATNPAELLKQAEIISGASIPPSNIPPILQTAQKNGFLQTQQGDGWKLHASSVERSKERGLNWLLHNYISLRIPLIRPEALLDRLQPFLAVVFSRAMAWVIAVLALMALYLVSRQWTEFSDAIRSLTQAETLLGLGLTILVVKLWHEIGHGHFARRYGCRVPSAGILLILGAPLFYTDVTDAWRLRERHPRMMIAAAGIMAEAIIAVLALCLWVFLQDGLARNIAFFVASGSLITSVLINMSPFMRFDGYFLLSDWLRIPNLHDRGFEAMKWYLRRWLLGFTDALPQTLSGLRPGWLALFGVGTALYRLSLFIGIALVVYHAFFKVAGVLLFAIEIAWFIYKPVRNEIKVWSDRRKDIVWTGSAGRSLALVAAGLILLLVPLSTHVSMKAVLEPARVARAYAAAPSVIESIHVRQGQRVQQDDVLLRLSSPALVHQRILVETRLALVHARLARSAADATERSQISILMEEERSLVVQRAGILAEQAALTIRAPMTGAVLEMDRDIHPGRVVSVKERLVLIASEEGLSARSFASSAALERLQEPASAVFVSENPQAARIPLTLTHRAAAPSLSIEPVALSAQLGGDVMSVPDRTGKSIAATAAYLLISSSAGLPPPMAIRGTIHIAAAPESLGLRALKRAVSVIIRESGV